MGRIKPDCDKLFNDQPTFSQQNRLSVSFLPQLARPIIEHIHDDEPHIVIAGDRGGRLMALTAMMSWRHRFPGERFPTLDSKIHLARITSRSANYYDVKDAAQFALKKAGLPGLLEKTNMDGMSPRVMYLDDWAVHGGTLARFVKAAEEAGVMERDITYLTICGDKVNSINHFIAEPNVRPYRSEWDDEGGSSECIGVGYPWDNPTVPTPDVNSISLQTRTKLMEGVSEYYELFDKAVALGNVATSQSLE